MIIGKGFLARAFEPRFGTNPDVVVFASGVSNSLETRAEEFLRERRLLCQLLDGTERRIVYFGSCGVVAGKDELTPYMAHKKSMEALVLAAQSGLVLRLPQVVGATNNSHTLTNFLRDRILAGEHFTVWEHAERNLVDVDDVAAIGSALAIGLDRGESSAVSIAAEKSVPMPEIVGMFEHALNKRANYTLVKKGACLPVDTRKAVEMGKRLGINLATGYIEKVIGKYYAHQQTDQHR